MALLGISGSGIVNGNTDRLIKAVLDKSGKENTFVNLSTLQFDPCRGCAQLCAKTNMCGRHDELHPYIEALRDAEALVLGTPIHHGNVTGWTFNFITRIWCFHHVRQLLQDKPTLLVITGLVKEWEDRWVAKVTELVRYSHPLKMLGHIYYASYTPPCYRCGEGNVCKVGGLWYMVGHDEERLRTLQITPDMFKQWEDSPETVAKVEKAAELLAALEGPSMMALENECEAR